MPTDAPMTPPETPQSGTAGPVVRRHLLIGWCCLLLFLSLGISLEAMHGLKVGWYLDASNHTRRLMLTLAHVHGTLLSIVYLGYAATLYMLLRNEDARQRIASLALIGATILIPGGFFAGGLFPWGGDPGLGIVLVPIGAVLLFTSVLLTALAVQRLRGPHENA